MDDYSQERLVLNAPVFYIQYTNDYYVWSVKKSVFLSSLLLYQVNASAKITLRLAS